ncbi:hypothetical protein VZT92_016156 [Zoarces viviparus]|uniref:B30.2/SPRY domain-containing protein n=1 Tax=Zoarces viviparus TaxID=48416 RepID=A0AAW1EU20_ZOAVI
MHVSFIVGGLRFDLGGQVAIGFSHWKSPFPASGQNHPSPDCVHSEVSAVPPISLLEVGVYLDWPGGTLSFYSVSSGTLSHLHTFYSTFTEPLYPEFGMESDDCSVTICAVEGLQKLIPLSASAERIDGF